jgi:nicotinamidase-related amidase
MKQALLVIDVQNDYFPGGAFPLWNADGTLESVARAVGRAREKGIPVILVQHVARGPAPFFREGTPGAELHEKLRAAAPDAHVVVKEFADSFEKTTLEETLARLGATELLLCGMMTQNCVTHTALSKAAEKYSVTVVADACTTVSEILHQIALHAMSPRVPLRELESTL